jgi:hypothetical protein
MKVTSFFGFLSKCMCCGSNLANRGIQMYVGHSVCLQVTVAANSFLSIKETCRVMDHLTMVAECLVSTLSYTFLAGKLINPNPLQKELKLPA